MGTISTFAALHLFSCLRFVATVGEQSSSATRDGEGSARAGETGEITEIRKMRYKKAWKASASHSAAQLTNAAYVVHLGRIMQERGFRDQGSGL